MGGINAEDKSLSKTWARPPHPSSCAWCASPTPLRRRQWCSLQKGTHEDDPVLSRCRYQPNHLSPGPTHPKPRESKPLQHFLLFPAAYKFCERKSAITRFQKKKRKRETNL